MKRDYYGGLRYGCGQQNYFDKHPHNQTFRMAKVMGKNRLAAGRIRLRYLEQQSRGLVGVDNDIARFWLNEILAEARYIKANMYYEPAPVMGRDEITSVDIQSAKQHPITNLIDFKRGAAVAWCHEDRRPSLSHLSRINKAHCHPCGKTFDTIDVLVQRDGFTFIEAVKELRQ